MKPFKILIVDDEEMLQDLLELILTAEFDCDTTKASNGLEAIKLLESGADFDLIISDYKMPQANGGELCLFNMSHKNLPFFLFSGGDLEDYPELSKFKDTNKYNCFFNKPFDEKQVVAATRLIYADRK
jgi:CheY-like chemotaxis protein